MSDFSKVEDLKIAVVHDHLGWMGGGEKTALIIALELGADFVTAYSNDKTYPEYQEVIGNKLKVLTYQNKIFDKEVVRFFWMRYVFWRSRKLLKTYDVLIASGQAATEAVAKYARPDCTKILYNHTPPRRIYDLFESSRKNYKWFLRPLFTVFAKLWEYWYISAIKKIDYNIANSENIKARFANFTHYEVNDVLWPPIETTKFSWISQGDYYLSWARVDENKRVDLIVEAFKKRPDKKLIVASGGPLLESVRQQAAGFNNIQVVGWQSAEDLKSLVGNCIAAVYIPRDEDAGMTHLEANAAGKPILGVEEGGLSESIIEGETGIKVKAHPTVDDILSGLDIMTREWCFDKKQSCVNHAAQYSRAAFGERARQIILENNPHLPIFGIDISRWSDRRTAGQELHTGVEVYVRGITLQLIQKLKSKARVRLYTPVIVKEVDRRLQKVIPGRRLWTLCRLASELKFNPPTYFFTPGYFIPRSAPKASFATIHDVLFLSEPARYSAKERIWQRLVTHWNIVRSKKIFTVSDNSAADIMRFYNIGKERLAIAPLGHERWSDVERNMSREKYVLYVGRVEKKKSVDLLIKAFDLLGTRSPDFRLLIAGKPGFGYEEIEQLAKKSEKIELLGYISDSTKKQLLSKAAIFVHPSSNEGSSFPVLEAWDMRVPVVVADCDVMREIAGNAAHYFKAEDAADLAEQIEKVIGSPELSAGLVRAGEERLEEFGWDRSAEIILQNIIE